MERRLSDLEVAAKTGAEQVDWFDYLHYSSHVNKNLYAYKQVSKAMQKQARSSTGT
jgi:hypothetical protein